MYPPHKKIILITGCSSGFGLVMAARLSQVGHRVFATMRNLQKKQALLDEIEKRGAKVDLLALDVTKIETIKDAICKIKNECGRIDVLVNNAGYAIGGFFEDFTDQEIRDQMETNFFGVLNVTREVIPLMREVGHGKIINMSSISGLTSSPSFSAYSASKWALEGFSEGLYYELKDFGIGVVLIEPGIYKTQIFYDNAHYAKDFNNPQSPYYEKSQFLRNRIISHSDKSTRDPEDIARLVERIIQTKENPLRNLTEPQGRMRVFLKKFFPFSFNSWLLSKVLFHGFVQKNKAGTSK